MSRSASSLLLACALAATVRAAPEDRGRFLVSRWEPGDVAAAGLQVPVVVYFPAAPGPHPVVGVIHGFTHSGAYHRTLAETLASRGLVAVVPDLPCGPLSCDHEKGALAANALLDWAEAQSAALGSPLAGMVDGQKRGLVGHSWGGLAVFLAAARDARVRAVVGLDPVDDEGAVEREVRALNAPSLHLLADARGLCDSGWDRAVFPLAPSPKLAMTVTRSGHCDAAEPVDTLCELGCGAGDARTTPVFRRYTVAWLVCLLRKNAAMAPWVGGSAFYAELGDGTLRAATAEGLEDVSCGTEAEPEGPAPEESCATGGAGGWVLALAALGAWRRRGVGPAALHPPQAFEHCPAWRRQG